MLEQTFVETPDDPDLIVAPGMIAFLEKNFDEAQEVLTEVVATDPGHSEAKHLLARVHIAKKSYPEAEALVLDILRNEPEEAGVLATYARIMMETLHLDKARALAEESLRLDPEEDEAHLVLLLLDISHGKKEVAQERLRQRIVDRPEQADVVASAIVVLMDQGRHREALDLGRELLRVQPDNEALVELMVELRAASHWSAWPLRPFAKWGWAASASVWFVVVIGLNLLRTRAPSLTGRIGLGFLVFVAYSWLWPPLLRRWLRWRGF